jgi:hypothetical protein
VSLRKTVAFSAAGWVVAISVLHAGLNLDLFRPTEKAATQFRVGFLPVT